MTSSQTLAAAIAVALKSRGVRHIFGVPGGGSSLDVIDAAGRQGIEFVLTRGETAAALMAAVSAELTAAPGVVLTGIGPGAASAVNGIAYASLERTPLLLITDAQELNGEGQGSRRPPHQVFDQQALFTPITKASCRLRPEDGLDVFDRLLALAVTPPLGPVHIDLSAQDAGSLVAQQHHVSGNDPVAQPSTVRGDITVARRLLSESRRPILIVGNQGRVPGVGIALRRLAEALGCPVFTSYKAKGVVADEHPLVIGHFTGARSEFEAIEAADLIIAVGLDPLELIPAPWRSAAPLLVLATHDGLEFPVEPAAYLEVPPALGIDSLAEGATRSQWHQPEIRGLAQELYNRLGLAGQGHTAESVTEATAASTSHFEQTTAEHADSQRDRARVTVDSGAHMFSVMSRWHAREVNEVLKSTGLSTMGFALPAAIASSLAEPERPVIAFTGDGGMMMCLAELSTAARLGCRLTVIVLNDAALSLIDIKQQRQQRPPEGVRTPAADFATAARGLGCKAWSVGRDDPIEPVLRQALAHAGPSLIDVAIDPNGYGEQLTALRG